MFLSADDLAELTGFVRPSAQIRWLTENGWYYAVDAYGRPRVALAEFNRHLVGRPALADDFVPDLSGL